MNALSMNRQASKTSMPVQTNCPELASVLLTHCWLLDQDYDLRTLRFDTKPRAAGRIIVGLVWRRRSDRASAVRHVTVTRLQAAELLNCLGGFGEL